MLVTFNHRPLFGCLLVLLLMEMGKWPDCSESAFLLVCQAFWTEKRSKQREIAFHLTISVLMVAVRNWYWKNLYVGMKELESLLCCQVVHKNLSCSWFMTEHISLTDCQTMDKTVLAKLEFHTSKICKFWH